MVGIAIWSTIAASGTSNRRNVRMAVLMAVDLLQDEPEFARIAIHML